MNQSTLSKTEIDARRAMVKSQAKNMTKAMQQKRVADLKRDMQQHGITVPVATTREALIAAGLLKPKAKP